MTVPVTVADAIEANAKGPLRVRVGQTEVEQHTIADQILADRDVKGKEAAIANRPGLGIRVQKITPYYP